MMFQRGIAPYWRTRDTVPVMMRRVLYSLAPAMVAYTWFFGVGFILNFLVAGTIAILTETVALRLRGQPVKVFVNDYSAIVTAILLTFALPPLIPWWITAVGSFFAIAVAKHLYGGIGFNVFNPAMAGYVALLISFPEAMSTWPEPNIGGLDYEPLSAWATAQYVFSGTLPDGSTLDAITRATPLDMLKTELGMMRTINEIRASSLFGDFAGRGWEWINSFIALGGFWLLYRGVIRWHIPVSMLAALMTMAGLFYIIDPATHPSPGFHLFGGGAMLGAFFVATDPVSAAATNTGRLIYGAGVGILTFVFRTWGSYPDGIAFSILFMNMAVPLIDRYTRPTIYGRGNQAGS